MHQPVVFDIKNATTNRENIRKIKCKFWRNAKTICIADKNLFGNHDLHNIKIKCVF